MEAIIDLQSDSYFMSEALRMAVRAYEAEEVPIGAVVVRDGKIIARAFNQVELLKDATAHAEILALTQAEAIVGDWRLTDCDLYVTKEPCPMCAGALVHVRMRRLVFGCADPRGGAAGGLLNLLQNPSLNHQCDIVAGVLGNECANLLQSFFRTKRAGNNQGSARGRPGFLWTGGPNDGGIFQSDYVPAISSIRLDGICAQDLLQRATSAFQSNIDWLPRRFTWPDL